MGCDESNPSESCGSSELPLYTVYLDGYHMDRLEVTNGQFVGLLNDWGNQSEGGVTWLDADARHVHIEQVGGVWQPKSGYEDHPVVEVSWYGAQAYCQWAGKRLPTEAEWEKAARGDSDTRMYPWGNQAADCTLANYAGCIGGTTEVGSYPDGASPYGALDTAGNAQEWVADWWLHSYYNVSPSSNPTGPSTGSARVTRGGEFSSDARFMRTAMRIGSVPHDSLDIYGFRCAAAVSGG